MHRNTHERIAPSVGSRGDSYDNALAESGIGLFKTEIIHRRGPWRTRAAIEFATLKWVDRFNTRRLLEPIGYVPPGRVRSPVLRAGCGGLTHITRSPANPVQFTRLVFQLEWVSW